MTTPIDAVRATQQQYLEAFKQGQKAVVDAVGIWAKNVEGSTVSAESLSPVELPAPKELVETTFGFYEELVTAQKKFTLAVLDAAAPALQRVEAVAKAA
jgi:hypothetical protein